MFVNIYVCIDIEMYTHIFYLLVNA